MSRRSPSFVSRYRLHIAASSVALLVMLAAGAFAVFQSSTPYGGARVANTVAGLGVQSDGNGLRLCNRTGNRVGVAVGYKEGADWTTEGWYNVAAGKCSTLLTGALVSRFYYIYAIDYDEGGAWGGNATMCTRDKEFTIQGIQNCVARGFETAGFFEVDTGEQKSWTVQLKEPDGSEIGIGG